MVNNVSFGSNPQQYYKDIENLAKYSTGASIIAPDDGGPFNGMGLMIGISGATSAYAGLSWLRKSYKNAIPEGLTGDALKAAQKAASPFKSGGWFKSASYTEAGNNVKNAWATYKVGANAEIAALKAEGGVTSLKGIKNIFNHQSAKTILDAIPTGDKFTKLNKETQDLYNSVKEAATLAKTAENSGEAIKAADKMLAEANAMAHGQIKAVSKLGQIGQFFSKYTGLSKLNGAIKNFATKSPLTAKILKFGKGNGLFLAITAAAELFTQVIPTFSKLGAEKGLKQTGKSAVKTVANVGGWAAGSAAGAYGGASLGAAIGIPAGPVGMAIGGAIGGICGMIGGFIGSWAAGKVADKVVGKNELDIAKEKEAKLLAEKANNDPKATQEIMAAAIQKLSKEGQGSDDAKLALGSLNNLKQAFPEQTQVAANTSAAAPATTPSFTGQNPFASNPFAAGMKNQSFDQQNYMDKDFMAMAGGLA